MGPEVAVHDRTPRQDLLLFELLSFADEIARSDLKKLDALGIAYQAATTQHKIMADLESPDNTREVQAANVTQLLSFLEGDEGKILLLRHGELAVPDELKALSPTEQKIRLMQPSHNQNGSVTTTSGAEAIGTGIIMAWIKATTGKDIVVRTAANRRSQQVAAIIAAIAKAPLIYDPRLDCLDYRTDISVEKLAEILGKEQKGALAWERDVVDSVSQRGKSTYRRLTRDTFELIDEALTKDAITICVTHTQQLNAADIKAGDSPKRLEILGMRGFHASAFSLLLPNGVYKD